MCLFFSSRWTQFMHCITATIDVGNVKGKHFLKKNDLAALLLHLMVNSWFLLIKTLSCPASHLYLHLWKQENGEAVQTFGACICKWKLGLYSHSSLAVSAGKTIPNLHLLSGDGATLGGKTPLHCSIPSLRCDTRGPSSVSRFTGDPAAPFVVKLARGAWGILKATAASASLSHGKIERGQWIWLRDYRRSVQRGGDRPKRWEDPSAWGSVPRGLCGLAPHRPWVYRSCAVFRSATFDVSPHVSAPWLLIGAGLFSPNPVRELF